MARIALSIGLGAAALGLGGDIDALPTLSAETVRMLDPSRAAARICAQRKGTDPLPSRLRLAALLVPAAAEAAAAQALQVMPPLAIGFAASSRDPVVRRLVRLGLLYTYGFNHGAAVAAFRAAQRRDPSCAICFWGEAVALGPNINAPMMPDALAQAKAATAAAVRLAPHAGAKEQALIAALAKRYDDRIGDRAAQDAAFADAMDAAAARYPADDDIVLLAVEAAMTTRPWDYWEADRRTPRPRFAEAVKRVEAVLARNPAHPQAAHLYIHLLEASDPKRAEAAADRLARLGPAATGHLVHMPSHIYFQTGRFRDSIRANLAAARADEAYLAGAGANPMVRYAYYPHNVHFLLTSAQMAGDMPLVIAQARRLRRIVGTDVAARLAWVQAIVAAPYLAHAQYTAPDAILTLAAPDTRLPYAVAMWRYARAVAQAQRNDAAAFERELAALAAIGGGGALQPMIDQGVPAKELVRLAAAMARGRQAMVLGRPKDAAARFAEAAAIEDGIPYQEPPYWYQPVRQSLGAAQFALGDYERARASFQAALVQWPGNGWALYGLARSERALGHRVEAAATEDALKRAWLGDPALLRMERL